MEAAPTRIKISINGISSGSLLKIGESVGITSKEALVAEAARRLLPEAGAKAVDPAAGELYLDGGFDVRSPELRGRRGLGSGGCAMVCIVSVSDSGLAALRPGPRTFS